MLEATTAALPVARLYFIGSSPLITHQNMICGLPSHINNEKIIHRRAKLSSSSSNSVLLLFIFLPGWCSLHSTKDGSSKTLPIKSNRRSGWKHKTWFSLILSNQYIIMSTGKLSSNYHINLSLHQTLFNHKISDMDVN